MRAGIVALLVAASLLVPTTAGPHQLAVKCSDESPGWGGENSAQKCKRTQMLIHRIWPDSQQHHAIQCFANESGLDKWAKSGRSRSGNYWGIAMMGPREREQTGWKWRRPAQLKAALRWWRGAGWDAWYAAGC